MTLVVLLALCGRADAKEKVRLDPNTATVEQLVTLPGIGKKRADAIVKARKRRPFRRVADLRRVRGIGPKMLAKLRPLVFIEPLLKAEKKTKKKRRKRRAKAPKKQPKRQPKKAPPPSSDDG